MIRPTFPLSRDKAKLVQYVNNQEYPNGGTKTYLGIDEAVSMVNSSGRSQATRVMVVITDGESDKIVKTIGSANTARLEANFTIFAVGVGSNVNGNELQGVASSDRETILVESFDVLTTELNNITKQCIGTI